MLAVVCSFQPLAVPYTTLDTSDGPLPGRSWYNIRYIRYASGGWRYEERSSRCGLVSRSSFRCVRKPAGPRQQDLLTRGDRTRIRHDTWTKRATHEEHLDRKSEDIVAAAGSTAIDSALRKRSHQSCAAGDTIGVQVESSFRCQAGHKNHASRNFDPKLEPKNHRFC